MAETNSKPHTSLVDLMASRRPVEKERAYRIKGGTLFDGERFIFSNSPMGATMGLLESLGGGVESCSQRETVEAGFAALERMRQDKRLPLEGESAKK